MKPPPAAIGVQQRAFTAALAAFLPLARREIEQLAARRGDLP